MSSWLVEAFTDNFIDRLFELVESSRNYDEELNYAVIQLIVCYLDEIVSDASGLQSADEVV